MIIKANYLTKTLLQNPILSKNVLKKTFEESDKKSFKTDQDPLNSFIEINESTGKEFIKSLRQKTVTTSYLNHRTLNESNKNRSPEQTHSNSNQNSEGSLLKNEINDYIEAKNIPNKDGWNLFNIQLKKLCNQEKIFLNKSNGIFFLLFFFQVV